MKLTVEELTHVIREVAKKVKKDMEWEPHEFDEEEMSWASAFEKDTEGKKGRDGYADDEDEKPKKKKKKGEQEEAVDPACCQPKGFKKSEMADFSKEKEGLYKRQGQSNLGPYTNEGALRAIVKNIVSEEFGVKKMTKKAANTSAPYNLKAEVGDKGSVGNIAMKGWASGKNVKIRNQFEHWYNKHSKVKNEGKSKNAMENVLSLRKKK